jgi:hypothetical protein
MNAQPSCSDGSDTSGRQIDDGCDGEPPDRREIRL